MKKCFLSCIFLFAVAPIFAQTEKSVEPDSLQGWTTIGNVQLLFNQSAFNEEWAGGGTSSIAGNLSLDYSFNYLSGDFFWDNKILATYGLTKLKSDEFVRKTSDRLELNSIVGKKFQDSNWFYSFFVNFLTQLGKGYEYGEDPTTGDSIRTEITHFLSPAFLKTGPGIGWKQDENLFFNFAPATVRFIFVDNDFTSGPRYDGSSYYGVGRGKSSRFEFGASFSGFAKFKVLENVFMSNSLSLYSNYLDKPGNIDIDYLMNLEMGINKYLTANLIFQAIYDDNTVAAFQIREVFGLGINYGF